VFPTRNEDDSYALDFIICNWSHYSCWLDPGFHIYDQRIFSDELLQFEDEMAHQETKIADANAKVKFIRHI
jgi:hypothetical protein